MRPFYEKTLEFEAIAAANVTVPKTLTPPRASVNSHLLALYALLLFISGWDLDRAVGQLAKLVSAPDAKDEKLGNLIGLNPFHECADWNTLANARILADRSTNGLDYTAQLAAIEARTRRKFQDFQSNW